MKIKMLRFFLLVALPAFAVPAPAQSDLSGAVLTIFPEPGTSDYLPGFCAFDSNYFWVKGRVFDLGAHRFLSPDSTLYYFPTAPRLPAYFSDEEEPPNYHPWGADPDSAAYEWAPETKSDTLVLWRHDCREDRIDAFLFISSVQHGFDLAWGKPGIWITDHREVFLFDRYSGKVLRRMLRPDLGQRGVRYALLR